MNAKLRAKFLIIYVLVGLGSFLLISTLGSRMVQKEVVESTSTTLYKEATSIANNQASKYYTEKATLENTYYNLKSLSAYQNSQIWIIGHISSYR